MPVLYPGVPPSPTISISDLEAECKCRLGVAADIAEHPEKSWTNTAEAFPTASTYKLPIAAAFLDLVEHGKFRLEERVPVLPVDILPGVSQIAKQYPRGGMVRASELLNLMITVSDNSASDAVLRLSGGPQAVTSWLESRGVSGIHVATSEREMGVRETFLRNSTTPLAMVNLLGKLQRGELLGPQGTDFLLNTLRNTRTFPGRIKGLLPPGTVVGHKTGTGGTHQGIAWATNDVGLIQMPGERGHIAIAVYVEDSRLGEKECDRVIARVTRRVWDAWAR